MLICFHDVVEFESLELVQISAFLMLFKFYFFGFEFALDNESNYFRNLIACPAKNSFLVSQGDRQSSFNLERKKWNNIEVQEKVFKSSTKPFQWKFITHFLMRIFFYNFSLCRKFLSIFLIFFSFPFPFLFFLHSIFLNFLRILSFYKNLIFHFAVSLW